MKTLRYGSLSAVVSFVVVGVSIAQVHPGNVPVCPPDAATRSGEALRCHARVVVNERGEPAVSSSPTGYGPAQFHKAYNLPTSTSAAHQIIAVVDAYDQPYIQSDLNNYSKQMIGVGFPACSGPIASSAVPCFQKVDQNGGNSYPAFNSSWGLEISLDVETAHEICQNCSILLVEAKDNSYANLMAAVDTAVALGANEISNSYGSNEFLGETSYDSHFNLTGVAVTFSSGDNNYGVEYPAASQYVTAVGGTTLKLNPDNSYNNESVWSSANGGTGSGCSAYELQPAWQTSLGLSGCSNRIVGDVAADADPNTGAAVLDTCYQKNPGRGCYGGGWFQVGGTSLASPLVAGVYALAGGVKSGANGNSIPYSQVNYGTNLHDITTGANGNCGTYLCMAVPGYDGPTGLGTPNGTSAF